MPRDAFSNAFEQQQQFAEQTRQESAPISDWSGATESAGGFLPTEFEAAPVDYMPAEAYSEPQAQHEYAAPQQESGYAQQVPTLQAQEVSNVRQSPQPQPQPQRQEPVAQSPGGYLSSVGGMGLGQRRQPVPVSPPQPVPGAEAPQQQPVIQGWTGEAARIADAPASSEFTPPVSSADMDLARQSDEYDRNMTVDREEYRAARSEARSAVKADSASRGGARYASLADTERAKSEEDKADVFSDPFRQKMETPYSEMPSSNRLYSPAIDSDMEGIKNEIASIDVGGRVWEKLLPSDTLRMYEVGLGYRDLDSIIEQNPKYLDDLLSDLFPDGASANHGRDEIARAINNAASLHNGSEIRVGVSKPPDVNISDAQSMVLRIMDQPRGIFIHPLIAPLFNADFDGDDANLSINDKAAAMMRDTIDLFVNLEGATDIDSGWFPTVAIVDNAIDDVSRFDFVRDYMFEGIDVSNAIINAVLRLGDDPSNKGENLVRFMSEIRRHVGSNNYEFERIFRSAYETFRSLRRYEVSKSASVSGTIDMLPADMALGEGLVDPFDNLTEGDQLMMRLLDDVVEGRIPPNWLDFKRISNAFIGEIAGTNPDFRLSASVGKKFKLDNSLVIGGEYVINLSDGRQVDTFLQMTFDYAMAERMSQEMKENGRSYSYARRVRETVVREVGYPDSTNADGTPRYANTAEWLQEFCRVYNREAIITNEADLVMKSNLQISQASNRNVVATIDMSGSVNKESGIRNKRKRPTYGNVADAIVSTYGSNSVERMFPNLGWGKAQPMRDEWVREGSSERESWPASRKGFVANQKYRSYSLQRFAKNNHFIDDSRAKQQLMNSCLIPFQTADGRWYTERVEYDKKENKSEVRHRFGNVSNNIVEYYLMRAIADQKTSSESTYASRVYGFVNDRTHEISVSFNHDRRHQNAQQRKNEITGKYFKGNHKTLMQMRLEVLQEMREAKRRGGSDEHVSMRQLIRLMCVSGSEMFSYFGMDNEVGWDSSEWSDALLGAGDVNTLGGVNMAMNYAWRTDRIFHAKNNVELYRDTPGSAELQKQNMNDAAFREQELAASSQTWEGIVRELQSGDAWSGLPSMSAAIDAGTAPKHARVEAGWYWANPLHGSIDEMMRDTRFGFAEKRDILCDVVRFHTGDSTFMSYEVMMQLEAPAGTEWSLKSDGKKQLFETYNRFEREFNQYGDVSYKNMVKNIEDAYEKHGEQSGALMATIHTLATHPSQMCSIGFDTMANGVCSVMDRLYKQTEKSKTHPWSNVVYQGLSMAMNGGYFNEIFRTDDMTVGTQHISHVSAVDLMHVLDDPDFVLTGYNDIGQVVQVNRDSLLGLDPNGSYDIEKEVWRFLRDNPRIAGCLRQQGIAVTSAQDASAYVVAKCDTASTIDRCVSKSGDTYVNPIDDVAHIMFDHCVFHGIASLATPAFSQKAVHRAPKVAEVERYMCGMVYQYATDDKWQQAENAETILGALGITREAIDLALMSDYDYELVSLGIDLGDAMRREADDRQLTAEKMYETCHRHMMSYLAEVAASEGIDRSVPLNAPAVPDGIGIDPSSVFSFYDVIQELSGAKTDVSTGIEGYETFQYSEWSSLISAEDRYASLDDVIGRGELTDEWNGMMTNGGTLVVQDGVATNLDELRDAAREAGDDEVVARCPDGYQVKDRTIDSQGRNVPSQRAYMMSKRKEGAEGHNLKVMKSGFDGTDSIVKVKSKYRQDGVSYDAHLEMVRAAAGPAVEGESEEESQARLFRARSFLARELLRDNVSIGYDRYTLSNYMCLADLMVVMGDDGKIYVRSLAQLYTALKYRIGVYGSAMSNDQRKAAAMSIVSDTSEYGCIGRARGTATEAFDALRPVRVAPSTQGMYPYLSDQPINRRALSEIVDRTGEDPWNSEKRESAESYIRKKHKWVNKALKDMFVLRQYHITGCVDAKRADEYHDIGMSSLFIVGDDAIGSTFQDVEDESLKRLCDRCYAHGETILVPASAIERNVLDHRYAAEAMPCATTPDGQPTWYMINTMNMRVNGMNAGPYKAAFAMAPCPYDKDTYIVEDTTGEFDYGDSGVLYTEYMKRNVSISQQPQVEEIHMQDLFAQQYRMLERSGSRHWDISVSLADQTLLDDFRSGAYQFEIDYGVVEGSSDYERRKRDVDAAIERYGSMTDDGDGNIIGQDCHAGDIVGWAVARVSEESKPVRYVLAPIIPQPLHGRKRGMETFQCTSIQYRDGDHAIIDVEMVNTSELDGYAKVFSPSGGADKMILDMSRTIDGNDAPRTLRSGTPISMFVDTKTTESRRVGTTNRLRTMETLIREARRIGYNLAESDGFFPDRDSVVNGISVSELVEQLRHWPPPTKQQWDQVVQEVRFHRDPAIDAFVRFNCKKVLRDGGNPSHFLASTFVDDGGNRINPQWQWEYLASFENSLTYEDSFLRFFHAVNPSGQFDGRFCPDGIDDNDSSCLFRLKQDEAGNIADGYDLGVLQMQVPHRFVDIKTGRSRWMHVWECVLSGTGFFGEDFSAGSRPNIEGASVLADVMNMVGNLDVDLPETLQRLRYGWSTADLGGLPMTGTAVVLEK